MNRYHVLGGAAFAGLLAAPTSAQFGNEWVSFQNDTAGRVVAAPSLSTTDAEEKDYAYADLDQDGWLDLIAVRKTPGTTAGPRVNVLFMNESGVLTDRTALYATATDVAGDQGFNTPTNDRDVKVADFDNDGWLDFVTSTALGFGLPKAISHPRIWMNQGASGAAWNGMRFEDVRFPQLFIGATPAAPDFCGVGPGDIDEDGDIDIHFTDYGSTEDRLIVNDGSGFFTDESALRMTSAMLDGGFGTSSYIVELNGLPGADVVRNEAGIGEAIYNNPASVGFYNVIHAFQSTSAYFVSQGDLNNDGRIDTVFSDDGLDNYRYNLSTDVLGRVVWGANKTFTFLTGGDDGFGAGSIVADLDGDGWKDVVICDVDVDVPSCGGRIHIYHNPGGAVGSEITLREEAGGSGAADWKGVKGLVATDLKGGYDVAAFDLDNDGDQDLVLGRCAGMSVWMNETFAPFCQKDLGFGGPSASLTACGAELSTGASTTLAVEASSANAPGAFAVGNVSNPTYIPLLDATIVPWLPVITVPFQTDATGTFTVSVQGGTGPATWYVQAVVFDPLEPTGFATTNALEVALLP